MGQSLRTRELSKASRPTIPRVALLAGAGQMMNCSGLRDPVDRVAFAQREIEIAFAVEGHSSGPIQRRVFDCRAIGRRLALTGAAICLDHSSGKIDFSNAAIPDVAVQQLAAGGQ